MTVSTQIEIGSAPAEVRKVFLDFEQYSAWTKAFVIKPLADDPKIAPGEKLKLEAGGMTFKPTILENSELEFRWRGVLWSIPGVFTGEHVFRFEPSTTTPGGTTLVQEEKFTGVLSVLMYEGSNFEKTTRKNFVTFNENLKARCEKE